MERIWLDVPYEQKDAAKAAGARWDPQARRWYAPCPGMDALQQWVPLPPIPTLLPGEDREFGTGLFVDLVPSSCWFTNVRTCVDTRDWDRLRTMIYNRAGQQCETCGATRDSASGRYLEAHERWEYDDIRHVQTLRRLVCLCTACHRTTHYGLATLQGKATEAETHLRAVTGLGTLAIRRHIEAAFGVWQERSQHAWALDLGILTGAGIRLNQPPDAATRHQVAARQTSAARRSDAS